jgi:hypothetical protein
VFRGRGGTQKLHNEDLLNLTLDLIVGRSQWPRGLRQVRFSIPRVLGSWVRNPLEVWMCVRVFLCCAALCG